MNWIYDDGGRSKAGFKGETEDCVIRAISIVTKKPYKEVYEEIRRLQKQRTSNKRTKHKDTSPRQGVHREVYEPYLKRLGYKWVPTMKIGSGCKVHLKSDELPSKDIIVRVSRHFVAVVGGDFRDTFDCSRGGTRCVYGYFMKETLT